MEQLSKKDYIELDLICNQITVLKLKRISEFGNNWSVKLKSFGVKKRTKNKVTLEKINKHLRKFDETLALNGYTKGKLSGMLKISRNVYYNLQNGYCSNPSDFILENTDWNNL
jgi:hypothetical protein